jgi:hypothetical protein
MIRVEFGGYAGDRAGPGSGRSRSSRSRVWGQSGAWSVQHGNPARNSKITLPMPKVNQLRSAGCRRGPSVPYRYMTKRRGTTPDRSSRPTAALIGTIRQACLHCRPRAGREWQKTLSSSPTLADRLVALHRTEPYWTQRKHWHGHFRTIEQRGFLRAPAVC